jgi:hypothetical protein
MTFQADWQKAMEQFFKNNVNQTSLQQGLQNPLVCSINADPKGISTQIDRLVSMKNWMNMQVHLLDQQIQMLSSQMNTINAMQEMQKQWQSHWKNQMGGAKSTSKQSGKMGTHMPNPLTAVAKGSEELAKHWINSAQQQVGQVINSLKPMTAGSSAKKPATKKASSSSKKTVSSKKTATKPAKKTSSVSSAKTGKSSKTTGKSSKTVGKLSKPVGKLSKPTGKLSKAGKTSSFVKLKRSMNGVRVSIQ